MNTLLIDTSYLIYRSYFAYPHLAAHGKHTGAIYGFIKTVMSLTKEYHIERLVFALDLPGKTWRHEAYTEYKAGRPEMDDAMRQQIPVIIDWARSITPYVFSQTGYEADDMIASALSHDEDSLFYVVSSDRDLYQLLTHENILFLKGKKGGHLEYAHKDFVAEFGIEPDQYVDYKALVGDGSDNIKGVPGIGPKTAAKLLNSVGSMHALYTVMNWEMPSFFREEITKGKVEEFVQNTKNHDLLNKIYENRESLELAYSLSLLHPQVVSLGKEGYDMAKGVDLYTAYEFKSLLTAVKKESLDKSGAVQDDLALF